MTSIEQAYVAAYCDVIAAVSDCRRYITSAHRSQVDTLEELLGETRTEELREVAYQRYLRS